MVRFQVETDTKPTPAPKNRFFQDTARDYNEREEIARSIAAQRLWDDKAQ